MTDYAGEVVFDQDYLPFGEDLAVVGDLEPNNDIHERYKYTGQRQEVSIGLYYYGARFYDPDLGRFITEDSYAGEIVNPQSGNIYIYTLNNPMRYVDPSGNVPVAVPGDPTGISSLFSILYNNKEWKNSSDNLMNQAYFGAKDYLRSSRESQITLLGKMLNWQVKQISWANERLRSLIPDLEIFPSDAPSKPWYEEFPGRKPDILESQGERLPLDNGPDISNTTDGFEPLPDWMTNPTLPIPLNKRSAEDSIMMSEGTSKSGELHHIASDKSIKSGFTEAYEKIFNKAGMSMQDDANKVFLEGHRGAHTKAYKQYVLDYITQATEGLSGQDAKDALSRTLNDIAEQLKENPKMPYKGGLE